MSEESGFFSSLVRKHFPGISGKDDSDDLGLMSLFFDKFVM